MFKYVYNFKTNVYNLIVSKNGGEFMNEIIENIKKKKQKYYTLDSECQKELPIIQKYLNKQGLNRYKILCNEVTTNNKTNENEKTTSAVSIRCYSNDQVTWKELLENNDESAAEVFNKLIEDYKVFKEIKRLYRIKESLVHLKYQAKLNDKETFIIKDVIENIADYFVNANHSYLDNMRKDEINKYIDVLELVRQIDRKDVYSSFTEDYIYIAEKISEILDVLITKKENNISFINEFKKVLKEEIKNVMEIAQDLKLEE